MVAQTSLLQKSEDKITTNICFFWDVSKLVEIFKNENKISQINIKTDSVKSVFFSKLCHQFRSLLNVIGFSNSLLKRSLLAQTTQQDNLFFISNIQAGVEEINQLLDELVFYGQLVTGAIEYKPNLIDLNMHCKEIVARAQEIANNKQQAIDLSNFCNFKTVYLDEKLLKPMLSNLLSNAIKYSLENSTIVLKISCQEQKIIFQIQDRGIGIDQSDLPRLFEPFFRGNNVAGVKGNGMGLAIVKSLIAIQGGSIDVSSQTGIGTTFAITLPFLGSYVI